MHNVIPSAVPLVILAVTLLAVPVVGAQTPGGFPASGQGTQQPGSGARSNSATSLGSIFFKSQNSFIFSIGAEGIGTDNLLFQSTAGTSKTWDYEANIFPRITYQRQTARTSIALDYSLGSRLYLGSSRTLRGRSYDLTHDGGFDLSFLATTRWSLGINTRVSVSPDYGRYFPVDPILSQLPPPQTSNSTVLVGLNKTIVGSTYFAASYQVNRRSSWGFGLGAGLNRFQSGNLSDMNRYGGDTSYSYNWTERTTLTFGYRFAYFDIQNPSVTSPPPTSFLPPSIVRNHNAYLGLSRQLTKSVRAFIEAGPNWTIGDATTAATGYRFRPGLRASVNGGIVFSQALALDPRTFLSFNVDQHLSDGFGVGAISQTQSVSASIGRRLTRKTTASVSGGYSRNKYLLNINSSGQANTTNGLFVSPMLRTNFSEKFGLYASYSYYRQLASGFAGTIPDHAFGNTVRFGITFSLPVYF